MCKAYLILVLMRRNGLGKPQAIATYVVEGNVRRPYAIGRTTSDVINDLLLFFHTSVIFPRQLQQIRIPLLLLSWWEHTLSHFWGKCLFLEGLDGVSLHLVKDGPVVDLYVNLHVAIEDCPQELSANTISIDKLLILMRHGLCEEEFWGLVCRDDGLWTNVDPV